MSSRASSAAFVTGRPGQVVAGRYRLRSLVGVGDMGVVWQATDLRVRRTVALKQLTGPEVDELARREAQLGSIVEHPRLLRTLDVLFDEARPRTGWLVLEYVRARPWSVAGTVALPAAAHIGMQVADALAALHTGGVVHGDVTPDNVLVDEDGEAKLVDYGAAQLVADPNDLSSRMTGGWDHRAPELRAGAVPGPAADIYALGACLARVSTGRMPGEGPFAPLLAADPQERPDAATARALLARVASRTR